MDLDMESDRECSTETVVEEDCRQQEPSHSPIYDSEEYHYTKVKPRKDRLVNKRGHGDFLLEPVDEKEYWCNEKSHSPAFDLGEDDDTKVRKIKIKLRKKSGNERPGEAEQSLKRKSEDEALGKARKKKKTMDNEGGREKKSKSKSESVSKTRRLVNSGEDFENSRSNRNDTEMEEMWDIIAGDSEDDQAGQRTIEDDTFINDTGVDPHDRIFPDDFIHNAPQAEEGEEDDEINNLFKSKKKKKKGFERSPEETTMIIEQFLAKFEVADEEDAKFNWQSKPAINKLKMLPLQTKALSN